KGRPIAGGLLLVAIGLACAEIGAVHHVVHFWALVSGERSQSYVTSVPRFRFWYLDTLVPTLGQPVETWLDPGVFDFPYPSIFHSPKCYSAEKMKHCGDQEHAERYKNVVGISVEPFPRS